MTRDELIARTRQLVAEGQRLQAQPSIDALRTWLQISDELLSAAWGTMDRYHLAWLMVGKPEGIVRGRHMTPDEEAAYVREVAEQKTAALRMSLDAVERQGMPFLGEVGGVAPGQGMGSVPGGVEAAGTSGQAAEPGASSEPTVEPDPTEPGHAHTAQGSRRSIPLDPAVAERLAEVRRQAAEHADHHPERPRAPRPEKMQR